MNDERTWAEIDLDAVRFNIESIKNSIQAGTDIIAVIKADGYGHGAVRIAKLLEEDERVWGYSVATAEEAFELRDNDICKPILILGYTFPYSYENLIANDIRSTVFMYDTAKMLSDAAVKTGKKCKVHIKIDTGMSRIGIHPDDEGIVLIKNISELPGLEIEGIFTHFATADATDRTKAYQQMKLFKDYTDRMCNELELELRMKHCSNSAGIIEMPEANMNAVRAGIILYGLWPSREVMEDNKIQLKPVLSFKSRIIYVKTIPQGQAVGYGGTYITERITKIATVCIGYGDGYPRSLSNTGYVLVKGQKASIVGRICMDQFMIDVTDIDLPVCIGDEVTLIGEEHGTRITVEELGELSGRFNYEFACDIGKRVPRVYKLDNIIVYQ